MRNGETADIEVANSKATTSLKTFKRRLIFAAIDVRLAAARGVDGNGALACP
jgi:hypothetical protein